MKFATRAIHTTLPNTPMNDIVPPVHVSSSFEFSDLEEAQRAFSGEPTGYVYGRVHNPTQSLLELKLQELEGGEEAVATSSGIAALSSFFQSHLKSGDEIIAHHCLYGNNYRFLNEWPHSIGAKVIFADLTDLDQLKRHLSKDTRFVFLESPTNPFLQIMDIRAISAVAKEVNADCVVDSTLASPALMRPLQFGADAVIHSLTKYIGGHGDMLGGAVIGARRLISPIRSVGLRYKTGATLSPFNAFLAIRGIKTLSLRMRQHSVAASNLAYFLADHAAVENVYYPTAHSGPEQKMLADTYMPSGCGGVLSFTLRCSLSEIKLFVDGLSLVKLAVSLGTCETLIEHPYSMTHSAYIDQEFLAIPDTLLRISIGLEDENDIINDIACGLDGLKG